MENDITPKEKFLIFNTLACVPTLLKGKPVLIDLRNETSVAGRILNADGFMNIHLIYAVFIDRHGQQYEFDEFIVKSRCIRQIQIPESIDVTNKLNAMMQNAGKRQPRNKKHTYVGKRAKNRHEEILDEIAKQNKECKEKNKNC